MKIPYVIDNQKHRMADVLNGILAEHVGKSLDIATAYFTIGGFGILKAGLLELGNFRLLLGAEPSTGVDLGIRPIPAKVKILLRQDLESLPFEEKTLRLIEDIISYLRRNTVRVRLYENGFLHAKCWLFYSDRPEGLEFDRFRPLLAIVGSSNFTAPGITSNQELNLTHKTVLDPSEVDDADAASAVAWLSDKRPEQAKHERKLEIKSEVGARAIIDLEEWYERQWQASRDFKQDLIELLDASKFGQKEYSPYEVYMKALFEYFKEDLGNEPQTSTRSAVELAEFQEDAVKKARKILGRYDGVMIADSVGLGKTWIGKKLLEDFAYHMRQKALVITPASLREMWEQELADATISATVLSQEELGREEFDPSPWTDADVILIDESHNFRNKSSQRYANLESILGGNGGRGREGSRKKVLLLTATPINNSLFDLYNQLSLVTRGDKGYFTSCGIGDLHKYFIKARREALTGEGGIALFNLLEEIVIRRTRPFIRKAYPEATIHGKKIHFPERTLKTVRYDLEATYAGIYDQVVFGIDSLKLAPYKLESYKKAGVQKDDFEVGREEALVGIFKSRYLKRFESSVDAFRISIRRALEFMKTFEAYILDGKLLRSSDFQKAIRYLSQEDEEDDATPTSLAADLDVSEEAKTILAEMQIVDPAKYDLRKLHEAVQHDVEVLSEIWQRVKHIDPENDVKLIRFRELLIKELRGKKVLIFTYYRDTARYLFRNLGKLEHPSAKEFMSEAGTTKIRRMDSGADAKDRIRIVQGFSPKSNGKQELIGSEKEIDILISTDVLSEGQNLQDCGYLVNYDLHWNPTRMVQRAGRVDRIGTEFERLWIYNMFPDAGLERLLRLVESLNNKIATIDQIGFLDASVLGEIVHPKNFNTLRRIRDEDGSVIEEEEQFAQLASSEFLLQQLTSLLAAGGQEMIDSLPDGIHSGLARAGAKGIFFYFQGRHAGGQTAHFWKYYDLEDQRIIDNRFLIANHIACERDRPRIVHPDVFQLVFDLQEKVIEDILRSYHEQLALEAAPTSVDPIQQNVATAIQGFLNHPQVDRQAAIEVIRFLNRPMLNVQVNALRKAYKDFQRSNEIKDLLASVADLRKKFGEATSSERNGNGSKRQLVREDLRLICFDVISS